jgi:hypothetical protein
MYDLIIEVEAIAVQISALLHAQAQTGSSGLAVPAAIHELLLVRSIQIMIHRQQKQ